MILKKQERTNNINLKSSLIQFSMKKPKLVIIIMVLATVVLGAMISMVKVDTDPENMLSEDEAVRIFHKQTKRGYPVRYGRFGGGERNRSGWCF